MKRLGWRGIGCADGSECGNLESEPGIQRCRPPDAIGRRTELEQMPVCRPVTAVRHPTDRNNNSLREIGFVSQNPHTRHREPFAAGMKPISNCIKAQLDPHPIFDLLRRALRYPAAKTLDSSF